VTIAYGDKRDANSMALRFRPLLQRVLRIETLVGINEHDMARLDREFPGRVDAFLARVSIHTGRSVELLRQDPLVLRAATFTMLCKMAKVRYLQTWFFYDMSFMAMFAASILGVPRGISCHVDHEIADHPLKLVALQVQTADLVLAISERTQRELMARAGTHVRDKILVKRIGIDATALRPLRKRRRDDSVFRFVSISRIEPKKGLAHLVEACAELRRRGVRFRARIVGGEDVGNPESRNCITAIRRKIQELGLDEWISMDGPIPADEVPQSLSDVDAFVAPYIELPNGDKDGIPTAMLEAMGAGLPVICTDAGAMTEAVRDGQEGLVVPQNDARALADALALAAGDPKLLARMGTSSAKRFDREFDARVTDSALQARIRELMADRRTTPDG
jgi:glycosyltransferase involved in cell wall biosynthesis